jgi:hypothetical protein
MWKAIASRISRSHCSIVSPDGDAAGQVGRPGAEVPVAALDHDQVAVLAH